MTGQEDLEVQLAEVVGACPASAVGFLPLMFSPGCSLAQGLHLLTSLTTGTQEISTGKGQP